MRSITQDGDRVVLHAADTTFNADHVEQARDSIHYVENDWCQELWSGGAYGGRFTTGGWTTFGPTLKLSHGRVHFAGTETATTWNGYIDGAISAGERAAAEIIAGLG